MGHGGHRRGVARREVSSARQILGCKGGSSLGSHRMVGLAWLVRAGCQRRGFGPKNSDKKGWRNGSGSDYKSISHTNLMTGLGSL